MRVLLVSHRFPPLDFGGVERYTQGLAAELVKAGDAVGIVTRRPEASSPEPRTVRERLPDGTSLYRFVGGRRIRFDRFLDHHESLERLFTAALTEEAPDVVHFNQLLGLSPRFVAIAHRLRAAVVISLHDFYFACPLVHLQKEKGGLCAGPDGGRECARSCFPGDAHEPALRWRLRTTYFRRLLNLAERLVAGSRYVASYFERFAPRHQRVRVIPNGVPAEEVEPVKAACSSPRKRGRLNLAYCGTVVPHKGIHVILDALRDADLGPAELLVLGRIPDEQGIPEYVQGLRERAAAVPGLKLCVYGAFQRAELPCLLGDVDCMVVPSVVPEAGPQVPREALARGIPVLVSRLGALPETVTEGENGFTFDPGRPAELAAILRRMVREEDLLPRLRQGALRTKVWTVSDHAEAVRSVYREAVGQLLRGGAPRQEDLTEIGSLHAALLSLGFAGSAVPCH
jgi:glycosyltransferase involved in cell wall biosynthesis